MGKGDPLCPLGFHPQVRWPTRCKRCFRDYKEHVGKNGDDAGTGKLRKDELTSSSPLLSDFDLSYQRRPSAEFSTTGSQGTSEKQKNENNAFPGELSRLSKNKPSSWSAQDLSTLDDRKLNGGDRDFLPKSPRRVQVQSLKEVSDSSDSKSSADVEFILRVKSSKDGARRGSLDDDDLDSISAFTETTDTTETTLIECNVEAMQDQIVSLKKELETAKVKCDRLEKENSELSKKSEGKAGKATATEILKLTQKLHEVEAKNEDLQDEKKVAQLRVKELEKQLSSAKTMSLAGHGLKATEELKKKLTAAEHLVEELMEENEELKKEMTIMVQEMDELHDNFREDQADEYRDLKKELEQTAKNCRILQFKLRKAERRLEQVEAEKIDLENRLQEKLNKSTEILDDDPSRVKMLEQELTMARELSLQMQEELQSLQKQLSTKESPSTFKRESVVSSTTVPHLSKSRSLEGSGLRRQASEESQLVRDLQDCLEREADLREQLKFSEEESQSLRKKVSRLEEENESLVMQLKKMAGKKAPVLAKKAEPHVEKDEGISDDLDVNELRLQLELNEQETSVLRRKLEEQEVENEKLNQEISKIKSEFSSGNKPEITVTPPKEPNEYYEQKIAVMDEEMKQVRLKLIEKERDVERLETELIAAQKAKSKVVVQRSRSLDSESTVDLKRQLQAIEQECSVLRQRTIDLENDCEKFQSENRRLQLRANRRANSVTPSEQLQIDNEDLKEQLKSLEKRLADANSRIKELSEKQESPRTGRAGTKLLSANNGELNVIKREKELVEKDLKAKEEELASIKTKLKELEDNNKVLSDRLTGISSSSKYKNRTPRRVTDLTTKNSLKKMVEELETEICDMMSTMAVLESQPKTKDSKKAKEAVAEEVKGLKDELEALRKERAALLEKQISLEAKVTSLEGEGSKLRADADELRRLQNKVNELERSLMTEKEQHSETKKKLESGSSVDVEQLQKVRQEKHKLQKELIEKESKINDVEKKLKDLEEKGKRNDRSLKEQKEKLVALEKELDIEKAKLKDSEAARKELKEEVQKEKEDAKEQLNVNRSKIEELESSISQKERKIKELELSVKDESRRAADAVNKKAEKDIKSVRDELQAAKTKIEDLEQKIVKHESDKRVASERLQKLESEWRRERDQLASRANDLEIEMKSERKKKERLEREKEQEIKEKSDEIFSMREKVKRLDSDLKAANDRYQDLKNMDSRSQELELELQNQRQEYDDLTTKYDLLEEEFVVTKAKLVMDNETLESDFILLKREFDQINGELKALRETYNIRQDTWIKEKLDMQEKVREMEEKLSRSGSDTSSVSERQRLKAIIEEKNMQIERAKEESVALQDQLSSVRKDADELRKKLEDFDRVSKVQRNITVDTSGLEKDVKDLRARLAQEEKSHRAELAQLKMKFDQRLALMNEEAQTMQLQVDKFKRERDTFKDILDGAQKMMSELKADPARKKDSASDAMRQREIEDTHQRLQEFHCQITNLEDELTEARMEASKVKTEYINEKSMWEIKFAELQTKINELEEDRVMSTGRSRIPGTKTRLEIAWQKEREDLMRLVSENAALAKDLRQTLFEVERERDRERLEAKRRLEQMQRSVGEEQEDVRKKVTELQCDLLELRDAHAKLRTSCEKLKRDKERVERERDELRDTLHDRHKTETEEEKKLLKLIDDVQKVKDLSPLVLGEYLTAEPQKEAKPKDAPGVKVKSEFLEALRKINKTTEDLKKYHRLDLSADYDPMKRRNADAADLKPSAKKAQSYKRSQSLEQSQAISELEKQEAQQARQLLAPSPVPYTTLRGRSVTPGLNRDRDSSFEDRLSDYSTTSEIIPSTPEAKKKKGIVGKIKQLTKSKSIEGSGTADIIVGAGIQALAPGVGSRGSDLSLDSTTSKNTDKEKKTVKDRLSGFFKKGTPSRTQSVESDEGSDISEISTSRPAIRIGGSTSNLSTTVPAQRLRGKPPLPVSRSINDPLGPSLEIEKLDSSPKSSRHLTPGYEPSMSPAGYSALLSASGGGVKRRPYERSQSAAGLKSQGSFETNV